MQQQIEIRNLPHMFFARSENNWFVANVLP